LERLGYIQADRQQRVTMQIEANAKHEVIEKFSRRSLWVALVIMTLLGLFAFWTLVGASGSRLAAALLPIAICVAVAALGKAPGTTRAQQAVQQDELRQRSLGLAQRDALIAVLAAQPLCAYATVQLALPSPSALMACATVTIGAIALLTSLLWRDR